MDAPFEQQVKVDAKYKITLIYQYDYTHFDRLEWLNNNTNNSVESGVVLSDDPLPKVFYAFENTDDALYFKIKYPSCQ